MPANRQVVGLIWHGSCLLGSTTVRWHFLADGKTWTGFPDSEDTMVNQAAGVTVNDLTIETETRKIPSPALEAAEPLALFSLRDGRLVTGQQHGAALFSQLVIEALDEVGS